MLVCAVDTSTPAVTAGVVRLEPGQLPETLARRVTIDPRAHCELITPQIVECCSQSGVALSDIEAIVAGEGPGPFTGLRVGLATAAALGDALNIPVYGVCSLDALAADAWEELRTARLAERTQQNEHALAVQKLLVVTDARRREAYWASYSLQGLTISEICEGSPSPEAPAPTVDQLLSWAVPERIEGPCVNKPQDIAAQDVACVCGARKYRSEFHSPHVDVEYPTPRGLVTVARARLEAKAPTVPLQPQYLRRPDAVSPRPRRVSAAITGLAGH